MGLSFPELISQLSTSTSPALTWYGQPAERVELSGKVLAQWAAKASNLLYEEGACGPVLLDLPLTWKALPWVLGSWLQGLPISWTGDQPPTVITTRPESHLAPLVVAVSLEPLAMRWPGSLPSGVLDGAADLFTQADQPISTSLPDGAAPALWDSQLSFGNLDAAIGTGHGRTALQPHSMWELVRAGVAQWRGGGSLVVFAEPLAPEEILELAQAERATIRQ